MPPGKTAMEMREITLRYQLDTECLPAIRRQLLAFRHDPQYRGNGNRVPLRQLSELCQVSRELFYILMRDPKADNAWMGIKYATRDRILAGFDLVLNHGLRWKRQPVWTAVMPDGSPPPQLKMRFYNSKKKRHDHPQL